MLLLIRCRWCVKVNGQRIPPITMSLLCRHGVRVRRRTMCRTAILFDTMRRGAMPWLLRPTTAPACLVHARWCYSVGACRVCIRQQLLCDEKFPRSAATFQPLVWCARLCAAIAPLSHGYMAHGHDPIIVTAAADMPSAVSTVGRASGLTQ